MHEPKPTGMCAICGKPYLLEESKVNAGGKPVHEDCYYETPKRQKSELP